MIASYLDDGTLYQDYDGYTVYGPEGIEKTDSTRTLMMNAAAKMEKKNIDWGNIGFGYIPTDYRYVSNYKDGKWDDGQLTQDPNIVLNECAGVLQYAQTVFEGLKAYTTEDGHIVTFRPDLNGERLESSAARLEMPIFPKERFVCLLYTSPRPRD